MNAACSLESLCSRLDPGIPVYALIDPLAGEPFALPGESDDLARERRLVWGVDVEPIVLPDTLDLAPACWPYLVPVDAAQSVLKRTWALRQDELEQSSEGGLAGNGTAACASGGWVQALWADRAAKALARVMTATRRGRPRYLRLGDSRVATRTLRSAGAAALWHAIGHGSTIHRWHLVNGQGDLVCLIRPGDGLPEQAAALEFDQDQRAEIERGHWVDAGVVRAMSQAGKPFEDSIVRAAADATTALEADAGWRSLLRTDADRSAAVALALLASDWNRRPAVRECLRAARETGDGLNAIVMDLARCATKSRGEAPHAQHIES